MKDRDKQSTIERYEFHFISIQRASNITYFAVRKTTQHKLPQIKLGPTIYEIGPPVTRSLGILRQEDPEILGAKTFLLLLMTSPGTAAPKIRHAKNDPERFDGELFSRSNSTMPKVR